MTGRADTADARRQAKAMREAAERRVGIEAGWLKRKADLIESLAAECDALRLELAAARREVWEEAARVCEEQRGLWPQWHPDIADHQEPINRALDYGRRQGCEVCAAALRARAERKAGDA